MSGREKSDGTPEQGKRKGLFFGLWNSSKRENQPEPEETFPQEAGEAQVLPPEGEPANGDASVEEKPDENLTQALNNPLYELYIRRSGRPVPEDENELFHLSVFMQNKEAPSQEQRSWLKTFERDARAILQKTKMGDEKPIDAIPYVKIAGDRMSAWLFILPPAFEGEQATESLVSEKLKAAGVLYGVDEERIRDMLERDRCFTLTQVATGLAPQDGIDGSIVDHYRRDNEIQLTVKDDNTIDYKDLGWLQTVLEEDVICDIRPPTDAVSGTNVRGEEVKGRNGRKAVPPKGPGTRINEGETQLLAGIQGVISFASGRFRVDPLLIIKGNVDTATGNLNVVGDLLINGDIQEGFTVEATGNITVQGMIEGAQVMSGGDIQVGRGMNGNSHGILQAKKEVRCKFIENGTVTAGGRIICDTIINSTISSDSGVEVKTGRGVIIGGSITALERIDALSIGNQTNRNIIINMGSTANFLREKYDLEQKRKEVSQEIEEIQKNIRFLGAGGEVTPKVEKMVADTKLKLTVQKMQLANLDRQIAAMEKKQTDNTACRLRAEVIYPPTQITIGSFTKILREPAYNALVYLKAGEVHVANV